MHTLAYSLWAAKGLRPESTHSGRWNRLEQHRDQ